MISPGALEAEAHRHLHARPRDVGRRRRPAGPQRREQVADRVEIVVRLAVFRGLVLRRHAFDRELQVLAVRIIDLGNARPIVEHAAKRRRARLAVEHAAGRMRKRRRIDLAPRLGIGGAHPDEQDDQTCDEAPEHAASPRRRPNQLDAALAGIKAGRVHFPAFMAASPRHRRLDRRSSIPETAVIIEKPRRTGSPAFAEDDSGGWRAKAARLTPSSSRP